MVKLAIIALFALILTVVVVRYSSVHGKLAIPPDYDDSLSMTEGGLRYLVWKNEGASAAWDNYRFDLPHSFLHYYLVAALFAVFGVHQAAVYWFGGVFLFITAMGLSLLIWEIGILRMTALLVTLFCLPVMFNMVFDFRSECGMAALLFAACCVVLKSAWAPEQGNWWAVLAGVLFAFCLGIKPAMFVYVLGMIFCCGILWLVAGALSGRDGLRKALGRASIAGIVAVVPFSFHYYLNASQIFGYIYNNAFASDFWKQKGTLVDQLQFHLFGFPGHFQLGVFTWPLLVIFLCGGIGSFVFRENCNQKLLKYLWSILLLTLMAYAGVAINSINQNYFSMTFDLLLATSAVLIIAIFADLMPRYLGNTLCILIAMISLALWRVPITQDYVARTLAVGGEQALKWRREGPMQVFHLVRSGWSQERKPQIWVGAYGWVDGNTITWEALKTGLPWKMWNYYARQPEQGSLYPKWADILVIPESGVMGTIELPLNKNLSAMVATAAKDSSLKLFGKVTDPNGKSISVYLRKAIAADPSVRE